MKVLHSLHGQTRLPVFYIVLKIFYAIWVFSYFLIFFLYIYFLYIFWILLLNNKADADPYVSQTSGMEAQNQ